MRSVWLRSVCRNRATSGSAQRLPALLSAYDFSRFERIVDLGGGHGAMLAGLLARHRKTRGVLYDLPEVVAGAEALNVPDLAEPCEIVGGDFFASVPSGGDAYILSRVIHDWDDTAALKILSNCRRAMRSDGRLLLIEGVARPPNEPDSNTSRSRSTPWPQLNRSRCFYRYGSITKVRAPPIGRARSQAFPARQSFSLCLQFT